MLSTPSSGLSKLKKLLTQRGDLSKIERTINLSRSMRRAEVEEVFPSDRPNAAEGIAVKLGGWKYHEAIRV